MTIVMLSKTESIKDTRRLGCGIKDKGKGMVLGIMDKRRDGVGHHGWGRVGIGYQGQGKKKWYWVSRTREEEMVLAITDEGIRDGIGYHGWGK